MTIWPPVTDPTPSDLAARQYGATLYLQMPGNPNLWRFTKITAGSWKRVDANARPGAWISHDELADLIKHGTIINPFNKENKS